MRKLCVIVLTFTACVLLLTAVAAGAPATSAEMRVSGQTYVRHDGGSDATIASCNDPGTGTTAASRRQQNEPAASVDPLNENHMAAGANDYCNVPTGGDAWAGFYYSANHGAGWVNSLVPGYFQDTSAAGQASPQYRFVLGTGDPVQAWDRHGHLYYGFIGFNRSKPQNASIFVAKYNWPATNPTPAYEFTSVVSRGTPGFGHFEDKIQLEVDRGVNSPYDGNVYVCWARFTGGASTNGVYFARSTNGGQTYQTQKISASVHNSQFCDIAVTKNGTVFVAWRQFAFNRGQATDSVVWAKSTNGGARFTRAAVARDFIRWDLGDSTANPEAREEAEHRACLAGDSTELGACGAEREAPNSRDCGDGPFRCESGYSFFREDSQVRITADPTASGNANAAYVVFNATVPGTETPTGTTFGTIDTGIGSQGQVYFMKTMNGGSNWSAPSRITPGQAVGHQFFPDIDANSGTLHAMWQDSRFDEAQGPPDTPSGGDFRTAPISNVWVSEGRAVATPHDVGVDTFYASSTNGGNSWAEQQVSTVSNMPQYQQFGNRDIPFYGDYNYISAVGDTVLLDWTDTRDTVPGVDPRYSTGADGFDVWQCRTPPDAADSCPNAGGLDQNIFGAVVTP
jgi:hypothetical protein